ncbi:MAG: glycosyltransferase [Flavobacteriales bacterium]|nr:glycosyltransferase [Flavobacteriales bacterium]
MSANKRHITVLVSNDLQFDQRVAKVCDTLLSMNYDVLLVGRMMPGSQPFERPYPVRRFKLWFQKGALFYAVLNLRLFFFLLFRRTDVILANDLDTLLPAFLVSRIKNCELVYDSHEYFTEAEGLTGRSFQRNVWLAIERFIFPKLKYVYTVNESIASIYRDLYLVDVRVVRNIPKLQKNIVSKSRHELGLPSHKKVIILQGAYIDPDRGGEELVQAMQYLDDVMLLIIGSGRAMEVLKGLMQKLNLQDKIRIMGKMPFLELRQYTMAADLGLSLDKPLHLNYTLSLPNKLFDYIHSLTPVLVSDLPELRRIVSTYEVGMIATSHEPRKLADAIQHALHHSDYNQWKQNCLTAREELNWESEEQVLRSIYSKL